MTIAYWKTGLCASLLVLVAGCGHTTDRQALQGSVTLDGGPLSQGVIQFVPQQGTSSPSAGGKIVNGEFSIAPERGVLPGSYRVEITASQSTGRKLRDRASGETTDEFRNFIPARYNQNSKSSVKVAADGPNTFDFALNSK